MNAGWDLNHQNNIKTDVKKSRSKARLFFTYKG